MASSSSSSAPNVVVNEETTTTTTVVKRPAAAAAALGSTADPAPAVKRRRLTSIASPPPPLSATKAAASFRRATSRSPVAGKTPRARAVSRVGTPTRTPQRLVRGIRTPTRATPPSAVKAASRASTRSAGKTATPAVVRGTTRSATSKEPTPRRLRADRFSLDGFAHSLSEIKKEAIEGRDAAAAVAASALREASIFDSVIRNTSKFSEICNSAEVSNPPPTVDLFLGVYKDMLQWKDVAETMASVELSAKYWVRHVAHELCLPNSPETKGTTKETTKLAKNLCDAMQRWFLTFVEDALHGDDKWKNNMDTVNKISGWLEQVEHQTSKEEWTMKMIQLLKPRIGHSLRRLEAGIVPPSTRSRRIVPPITRSRQSR